MRNEFDHEAENQWVDDQLASLEPPSTWQPNSGRALDRLSERRNTARAFRWGPISMAAMLVAVVGLVLLVLPWQVLMKSVSQSVKPPLERPMAPEATQIEKELEKEVLESKPAVASVEKAVTHSLKPPPVPKAAAASAVVGVEAIQAAQPQSVGNGVTEPKAIYQVQAQYTEEAKAARIQGSVELLCLITEDGAVQVKEITQSVGYGLDESAAAAIAQWRFEPGKKDGKAVPVFTSIRVHFTLR